MFATAFGDLPAVDPSGQFDVGDQHVRDPPLAPCQCLFPVSRMDYLVAFLAQRLDDEFADKRVILDDEYSRRRLLNTFRSDPNLERPNLGAVPVGAGAASKKVRLPSGPRRVSVQALQAGRARDSWRENPASFSGAPWDQMDPSERMPTCPPTCPATIPTTDRRRLARGQGSNCRAR
jgi:hypothetical protein